jgi:hypothetical protein
LLIAAEIPLFRRVDHQTCFGGKWQLLWAKMSCDTSMCTVKKGAAQDFHSVHIYGQKETLNFLRPGLG